MATKPNTYSIRAKLATDLVLGVSKKKLFSLEQKGSTSLATWFLGPKSENVEVLKQLINVAIHAHADARKEYAPGDPPYVTDAIRNSEEFKDGIKLLFESLLDLSSELKGSVPFYSHRWQGHMNWDTTLPSLVGFFAALLYNPNNVAAEASPVTTHLESLVGDDLCRMLGFAIPGETRAKQDEPRPWGHITCDGSVANLEGMWFARNVKFLPAAVAAALRADANLAAGRTLPVQGPSGEVRALLELSPWELVNVTADEAIALTSRLTSDYGIDPDYLGRTLGAYTIQELGWLDFWRYDGRSLPAASPAILTPATAHYSWPKNAAILGIGDNNRLPVRVDQDGRLDVNHLREILSACLRQQRPILQVVAVLGTTEEGSVDPLRAIVELRKEYRKSGLDFPIHVDAAWGGYFASLLHPVAQRNSDTEDTPTLPLSDFAEAQFRALPEVETVTVDPHKAGYINYPAGALCYRNGAFRDVVTFTAPVVYHGGTDPTVGVYGVEGSKSGAAATAAWFSHRIIPTNQAGYGKLLGRANFNNKRWYAALLSMPQQNDPFEIIPFQRLPAEKEGLGWVKVREQREWISREIVPLSDKALAGSREKMEFLRNLGSDLSIVAYVVNFLDGENRNTDIEKMNLLNDRIFSKLSQQVFDGGKVPSVPLFITSSTFDARIYGNSFIQEYCDRIGVVNKENAPVTFLISSTMNPTMSDTMKGNYVPELIGIFRKNILEAMNELGFK